MGKRLGKNLVSECTCEIRFIPDAQVDVGLASYIANSLKNEESYKDWELVATPEARLPQEVISQNNNFRYKSLYQLKNNEYIIGIGTYSVLIDEIGKYESFTSFYRMINSVLSDIKKFLKVKAIKEIRLRYLNTLYDNLMKVTNFSPVGTDSKEDSVMTFQNEYEIESEMGILLTLCNKALVIKNGLKERMTVIDYDSWDKEEKTDLAIDDSIVLKSISKLHDKISEKFEDLLKPDYVVNNLGGWNEC